MQRRYTADGQFIPRRQPEYRTNKLDAFMGIDIGKRLDYSAICVLMEGIWDYERKEFVSPTEYPPEARARLRDFNMSNHYRFRPPDSTLYIAKLERIPLGTSYPKVVDRAVQIATATARAAGNTQVVLDRTGVGDGVLDMFRQRDVWPVPIVITGGERVHNDDGTYSVPRTQLINKLDVAYQSGRISIHPELPMLDAFETELESFEEVRAENTGHLSYRQIRSSKTGHADLVLAASLALFYRDWYYSNMDIQAWEYWRRRAHEDPIDFEIYGTLGNTPTEWELYRPPPTYPNY